MGKIEFRRRGWLLVALAGCPLAAAASHNTSDVHLSRFECTACHTVTPQPGDTSTEAPLVLPAEELCLSCHRDQ